MGQAEGDRGAALRRRARRAASDVRIALVNLEIQLQSFERVARELPAGFGLSLGIEESDAVGMARVVRAMVTARRRVLLRRSRMAEA